MPRARFAALLVPLVLVLAQAGAAAVAVPAAPTIGDGPEAVTASTNASFTFTSSDAASFECSLDGAAFTACTSPASYTALPEGLHSFRVRGVDGEGPGPAAERTWRIDQTAPVAPTLTGPSSPTSSTSAQIGISHGEAGVSFLCKLDAEAEEPCTSPKTYTGLAAGSHTVSVRARDAAGNTSTAATHGWTIDTA